LSVRAGDRGELTVTDGVFALNKFPTERGRCRVGVPFVGIRRWDGEEVPPIFFVLSSFRIGSNSVVSLIGDEMVEFLFGA